ncbi:hypothetical protein B0F90DRAFT_1957494, partial [Multifurca ochricompacta]
PVITVIETPTGVKVRQDRFLEDGPAKLKDNETIWWGSFTASASLGQAIVSNSAVLKTREAEFKLDISKSFKISVDSNGICKPFIARSLPPLVS